MDYTANNVKIFDKNAQKYQEKFMDVGLYQSSLDVFCKHLVGSSPSVLDVGCGPGNVSRYLIDKMPDLKLLGIDLSENMLNLAKANNPSAVFKLMDCRKIAKINNTFDGIICGFCLPYLPYEQGVRLIEQSAQLLNPKGLLYLSFMDGKPNEFDFQTNKEGDQVCISYYYCETLLETLNFLGFNVIVKKHINPPNNASFNTSDVIIIAKKN